MMALLRERCRRQTRGFPDDLEADQANLETRRSIVEANRSKPHTPECRRIWLADRDGNLTRALAWTWPILKRREPRKYRWWMNRANHAREPAAEAVAALKELRQGNEP